MKNYDGISIRTAASYREEARLALKGKWKAALLLSLVLLLMTGAFTGGAGFSYSSSTEITPYWQLKASIGPFQSISLWKDGELIKDYASTASSLFLLPYSPFFAAAAALTALFFMILIPIATLGDMRLQLSVLDGVTPDFSILRTSRRQYWLLVRTYLAAFFHAFWPTMILCFCSVLSATLLPEDLSFLVAIPVIACFVVFIIRIMNCSAIIYLVASRPDMTAREAVKTSKQMMKGRKWRYIFLGLSFFGWDLLFGLFVSAVTMIFNETPLAPVAQLIILLFSIPLSLYTAAAQIAFLRDADIRTNGWSAQADAAAALFPAADEPAASSDPAPVDQTAQPDAPAEESQPSSTPDDPWTDQEK